MNLNELQNLINIREYINTMVNNYNLDKIKITDLRTMIILIDNKIVTMLLDNEFKNYINFENAKTIMAKAAEVNNIKSGLPKKYR